MPYDNRGSRLVKHEANTGRRKSRGIVTSPEVWSAREVVVCTSRGVNRSISFAFVSRVDTTSASFVRKNDGPHSAASYEQEELLRRASKMEHRNLLRLLKRGRPRLSNLSWFLCSVLTLF